MFILCMLKKVDVYELEKQTFVKIVLYIMPRRIFLHVSLRFLSITQAFIFAEYV